MMRAQFTWAGGDCWTNWALPGTRVELAGRGRNNG